MTGTSGEFVAQYELLDKLGEGGMGVVYAARDTKLKRTVALKFLPQALTRDADASRRFRIEAQAAAALEHPNVCTVHEIGEAPDGRLYIVMSYYGGETLDAMVKRGPIPIPDALRLASQAASGIAHAHQNGVIHRDIKPANLMIAPDGAIRILDFGVAKVSSTDITRAGTAIGTLAYMSPEQIRGDEVGVQTDIWSLGVVLYEMLTGRQPFAGVYEQAVGYSILSEEPQRAGDLVDGLPEELEAIIGRSLEKRAQDRWVRMEDFADALVELSQSVLHAGTSTQDVPAPPGEVADARRAQVTVLALNILGMLDMVETLPPDQVAANTDRIHSVVAGIVSGSEGTLHRVAEDEVIALFGLPVPGENDALMAVDAAVKVHKALAQLPLGSDDYGVREVVVQAGVDTGRVVAQQKTNSVGYSITGPTISAASQLALHAEPGETLISSRVRRLTHHFFEMEEASPVRVRAGRASVIPHRVLARTGVHSRLEAAAQDRLTSLAGRDSELETLAQCLERATSGDGQFVTVVGEAGLGKSRLLHELLMPLSENRLARVVVGRCKSNGADTSFLPFVDILQDLLNLDGDSASNPSEAITKWLRAQNRALEVYAPFLRAMLGADTSEEVVTPDFDRELLRLSVMESLTAIFTQLSSSEPLVLALEDWHWSDEASRDLLRQLALLSSAHPILLIVSYRPSFSDAWNDVANHTHVRLRPLVQDASNAVVRSIFGVDQVPEDLQKMLFERTGGNPFFLEEICRTLQEEGTAMVEDGALITTKATTDFQLPDSVEAVIRTRLHRLNADALEVVEVASVVGREFTKSVLSRVLHEREEQLIDGLKRASSAGMIQQTRIVPDATYRFKHALVQEVAYQTLLHRKRKDLHGRVANALLEETAEGQLDHVEELVHHYVLAEDWHNATTFGLAAADKAARLYQERKALNSFNEVLEWCINLPEKEAYDTSFSALLRMEAAADSLASRDEQTQILARLQDLVLEEDSLGRIDVLTRKGALCTHLRQYEAAQSILDEALSAASHVIVPDSLKAGVLRAHALLYRETGLLAKARRYMEEAVELQKVGVVMSVGLIEDLTILSFILREIGDYEAALVSLREVEAATFNPGVADVYNSGWHNLAQVYMAMGQLDKASEIVTVWSKRDYIQEFPIHLSFALSTSAHLQLLKGNTNEAISLYEQTIEACRKGRSKNHLSTTLKIFGDVLVGLNKVGDAIPVLEECVQLLEGDDTRAFVGALVSLADAYEQAGRLDQAIGCWQTAAEFAVPNQLHEEALNARLALARLSRAMGIKSDNLPTELEESLDLAQQINAPAIEAEIHNSLGIHHWELRDYESAEHHYKLALKLYAQVQDKVHEGFILNCLGVTQQRLGNSSGAITTLTQAILVHQQTGERILEAQAEAALGDSHLEAGEFDQAITHFNESVKIRVGAKDRLGEARVLLRLARAYVQNNQPDDVSVLVSRATEIAKKLENADLLGECRAFY